MLPGSGFQLWQPLCRQPVIARAWSRMCERALKGWNGDDGVSEGEGLSLSQSSPAGGTIAPTMRLSMALWADASRMRTKRRRYAETGPCVPRKQRSDLLLSHPGPTVVSRRSGARADSCSGNKADPVPASSCPLTGFRSCKKSWFARGARAGRAWEGSSAQPLHRVSHCFQVFFGIRRDRMLSPKHEHFGRTCLITGMRISANYRLVNSTKDAILDTTLVVNCVAK